MFNYLKHFSFQNRLAEFFIIWYDKYMKKIPKIIHYVWLGGKEKSELAATCIKSFKTHNPDYQIKEWNESNILEINNFQVNRAIEEKNWAYASDIIRVYALKEYGGIYLDTDVLLIKSLDSLLDNELFLSYESKYWFGSAVIGVIKDHPVLNLIYLRYLGEEDIKFNTNALTVHAFTAALKYLYNFKPDGLTKEFEHLKALSSDYFYPIDYMTLKDNQTTNTIGIHYYAGSWHDKKQQRGFNFAKFSRKIFGKHIFSIFEKMVARSYNKTLQKEFRRIKEIENEVYNRSK